MTSLRHGKGNEERGQPAMAKLSAGVASHGRPHAQGRLVAGRHLQGAVTSGQPARGYHPWPGLSPVGVVALWQGGCRWARTAVAYKGVAMMVQ
ncbi:hypothetical protein BHE74_00030321 [Ensete ventricosum]|nr:hypothetical protein GW17_00041105 [Ensete ventricosum]RWW62537.1 hypothetical protein BHE74_00030321 [Ensete ventricosum]